MTFQLSESGRVVTAVAVSQGVLKYANAGDTIWTEATNNSATTPPLDATNLNFGTPLNGLLYFVDGLNFRLFDPSVGIVDDWVATAGSLPVDSDSRAPRGIETWRGRIVLFGLIGLAFEWFMSRIGDPTDWEYAPPDPPGPAPDDPVSSQTGPQGVIGDVVTAFVPFNDDIAFFGCSHSIYMLQGDPQDNGQISLVTDAIGFAFGRAWCKGPDGTVYFFSNRCGIFSLVPGGQPKRLSQNIEQLVQDVNTGLVRVTMMWDDRFQCVHVWLTPFDGSDTDHLVFEVRTNAWFQEQYDDPLHNPLCACQFDGNTPEDRVVLIGSFDGVVRFLDPTADTDDGTTIFSTVVFPPILAPGLDDMILTEWQAVLGSDSGPVTWGILAGTTAEQALSQSPQETGTWQGGRNETQFANVRSHVLYPQITAEGAWRMETIRAIVRVGGLKSARALE